jgi:hypothetical protein
MDLGSIFLILALLILAILFIAQPFLETTQRDEVVRDPLDDHELSSALAERDRVLTALQELDFDHNLGKIPAEDYAPQRAHLVQRGVEALRRLDTLQERALQEQSLQEQAVIDESGSADLEWMVSGNIALAGNITVPVVPAEGTSGEFGMEAPVFNNLNASSSYQPAPDDPLETALSNRRRARTEKASGFCPQCGGPILKSDHFCPQCGAALTTHA